MNLSRRLFTTSMIAAAAVACPAVARTPSAEVAALAGGQLAVPRIAFRVFSGGKAAVDSLVEDAVIEAAGRGRSVVFMGDNVLSERVRRRQATDVSGRPSVDIALPGFESRSMGASSRRLNLQRALSWDPDVLIVQDIDDPAVQTRGSTFAHASFLAGHNIVLGVPDADVQAAMTKLARNTQPYYWHEDNGRISVVHDGVDVTREFLAFARRKA